MFMQLLMFVNLYYMNHVHRIILYHTVEIYQKLSLKYQKFLRVILILTPARGNNEDGPQFQANDFQQAIKYLIDIIATN